LSVSNQIKVIAWLQDINQALNGPYFINAFFKSVSVLGVILMPPNIFTTFDGFEHFEYEG